MNKPHKPLFLLSVASFFFLSSLSAVQTDPVGYVTTTTPSGDDSLIGLPLTQTISFTGVTDSATGAVATVSSTLVLDAYNNTHYALATSGANAGQWSEILDTAVNSIETNEVLLSANDTFDIIPFWTLATAFPGGNGIGASSVPTNPSTTVSLNNLNAAGINLSSAGTYFYFAGNQAPGPGWYQTGSFAVSNDLVLSPETYITIRNNSASPLETIVAGAVPTSVAGTTVTGVASAAQDNQLVNPYPADLTLATSGLTDVVAAAANALNPLDTVSIYDIENTSGQNISSAATYFYFSGPTPAAGWYQTGTFAPSDAVKIPGGGAFVVRKGLGDNEVLDWNPPLPYSL